MTYDSAEETEFERRAGYTWDVEVSIDPLLVLNHGDTANFIIYKNGETIFSKGYGDITISGQDITITAAPSDTEGKQGVYNWKLDGFIGGNKILLGSGNFILK